MKYFATILLCMMLTLASAQNISVSDFRLDEMDLTANQQGTTVLDQNGEKCALIKVKTTQTGFSFDAGSLGVSKTLQKTAEIWVYVPHGVRKLSISHQKFGSLEYTLPMTTQKAKTYVMELKAETPIPVNSQRLLIKCMQKNAVVSIDGEMIDLSDGMAETVLSLGAHNYVAMANGYYQTEGTIELKADRPGKLTVELEPKPNAGVSQDETSQKKDTERESAIIEPIDDNANSSAGLLRQFVSEVLSWYNIENMQVDVNELARKYKGKLKKDAAKYEYLELSDKTKIYYSDSNVISRIELSPKSISKTRNFPSKLGNLNWDSDVADWTQWLKNNDLLFGKENKYTAVGSAIQFNKNFHFSLYKMKILAINRITIYFIRSENMSTYSNLMYQMNN